jgi:hypothetical protein
MKKAKDKPSVVGPEFQDVTAPKLLDILISHDGKRLWINNERGICIFRACKIRRLILTDERTR